MTPLAALRALACLALTLMPLAGASSKPNIVFILADDLGYSELGCYGQARIRTPRIDHLATEGMRFTRSYSGNAVCAPSRCVLMTGRHPGHAEVRDNRAMTKFGAPEGQHPLSADEVTIAELLRDDGYTCGAFGKWGLGFKDSSGNPLRQGFDRFFGYHCQAHAHSYYPATLWSDNELFPLKNNPPVPGHANLPEDADPADPRNYDAFKGQDYAPDRINEQALRFIRKNREKPFFLYYPTVIPHVALHVPDKDLDPYLAEKWNDPPFSRARGFGYTPHFTPRAAYAAMITRMDSYVGRVLDLLDELNLADNTIVVFTSDNGTTHLKDEVDYDFFRSVHPLRGLKGSLYEGGVRIPLIVRWPGKVRAGSISDTVTGFEDWLPTLLELAGSTNKAPGDIDGISIASALQGKDQPQRDFLYREFAGYGGQQAVWLGDQWKAVRQKLRPAGKAAKSKSAPKTELYDLKSDPSESRDLAAEHPDLLGRLEKIMEREHTASEIFPIPLLDAN